MTKRKISKNVLVSIVLSVVFWTAQWFAPTLLIGTFIWAALMISALSVLVCFGLMGWRAYLRNDMDGEDHLFLGVCMTALGVFFRAAIIVFCRLANLPLSLWLPASLLSYTNGLVVIGYILHVTAPSVENGFVPPRRLVLLAIMAACVVFLGWAMLALGLRAG